MSIKTKLNASVLVLLFITFMCLTVVINVEVKTNGAALVGVILDKMKKERAGQVHALTDTFLDVEKKLETANQTTREIVTDLYIASYGILTKSTASQIFPLVVNFELESADTLIHNLLKENRSISWICYTTSEDPTEADRYAQGTKLAGTRQKIFNHVIQDDINYLKVQVQVNLESMAGVSQIAGLFGQINQENQKIIAYSRASNDRFTTDIKAFAMSASRQNQTALNVKLTAIMVLAFVVVATVLFFISQSIIVPILTAIKFAERVSQGDFTQTITSKRKDETGTLTRSLVEIVVQLGTMLRDLKKEAGRLSDSSLNLSTVSESLSSVSEKTHSQAETVSEAAQSISEDMNELVRSTHQAVTNIDTIANSADEMNATVSGAAHASGTTRDMMSRVVTRAHRAYERTKALEKSAQDITVITDTITDISESTNLLSLNASIEAARAGDAGKGFAIVATEIKGLAGEVAEATCEIKKQIDGMRSSTEQTVSDIGEISELISQADGMAVELATSMETQSAKTKEIAESVSMASVGIKAITANLSSSKTSVENITLEIGRLNGESRALSRESLNVKEKSGELHAIGKTLFHFVDNFKM